MSLQDVTNGLVLGCPFAFFAMGFAVIGPNRKMEKSHINVSEMSLPIAALEQQSELMLRWIRESQPKVAIKGLGEMANNVDENGMKPNHRET